MNILDRVESGTDKISEGTGLLHFIYNAFQSQRPIMLIAGVYFGILRNNAQERRKFLVEISALFNALLQSYYRVTD
jgi:hypothetical protein